MRNPYVSERNPYVNPNESKQKDITVRELLIGREFLAVLTALVERAAILRDFRIVKTSET